MHDLMLLAIIWVSVFFAAWMAQITRVTPVLWFLFFGTLMANTGILPSELPLFIQGLSELGIIIIMFALGFEENVNKFLSSIKRAWGIALFGALVPFSVAFTLALQYWGDHNIALMCGLTMTATAVSLTMVSLKSEGLNNRFAATAIVTSVVIDDLASLAALAVLIPIATGEGSASISEVVLIVSQAIGFFLMIFFLGRFLFPANDGWVKKIPIIGQLNLRLILSMADGKYAILLLVLVAVSVGLLAHVFGLHPAIGAYMAGLVVKREYFDFQTNEPSVQHKPEQENAAVKSQKDYFKRARTIIDNIAFTWLGPIFFVTMGSHLVFDSTVFLAILPEALMLFLGLFFGQIISAGLAAKYTGGFSWPDSFLIGFGMLGRAELAFVVMNIAFVENDIFTLEVFYTLMLAAFLLNISVPITIKLWKIKFSNETSNTS